ncbi:efflux RND transporter periplasmic adaptor subunit [Allosphingosinicella sp.]|uniref:efflux RND transporter periplasmic adaptor subunit n=1 Tax=Allosphingosinicella sp. TaxID=2823234 RepID=UPI003784ED77
MTDTTRTDPNGKPDQAELEDFLGAPAAKPWYKRPIFIAGIVVILAVVFLLARCFTGSGEGGYATETVRRGNLQVTVTATGNLQPTNEVQVGSEQSGLVTGVFVDNNDRVTQGQPLARLDTSRLQDAMTQARAGLAQAQAEVATAAATLAQNRADLSRQEEVYRVSGGRVPSRTELDAARATYQRGLAGVRAAQAGVTTAQAQVSSAQTNLSKATIYSPVNGVVLSRQVDPGQTVAASLSAPVLFTIAEDLSQMKLEVRVDEADVGQVSAGQRATFTVDAYPGRTFQATVLRVDVGANASGSTTSGSSASNAASSTNTVIAYTAVLSVANPEMLLRPGMTATAEIVTAERQNALLVPNAALRWSPERDAAATKGQGGVTSVLVPRGGRGGRGGGRGGAREVSIGRGSRQTVYVLGADGQPQAVQIIVGESNGSVTEVTGGNLREGQEVITSRLAPGQVQEKSDRSGQGGQRGQGRNGNQAATANQAAPAAPPNTGGNQAQPASPVAPPVQNQAAPAAPPRQQSQAAAPPAPSAGQNVRDMTPDQRRAYFQSLTPEQRAALRERRQQRQQQGGGAPDGQ